MRLKALPACLFFVSCFSISQAKSSEWVSISSEKTEKPRVLLLESDINTSVLSFETSGFLKTLINSSTGNGSVISLPDATQLLQAGYPDLAKLTASVIIPDLGNMQVEVINSSFIDFENIDVIPSKGNISRKDNPSEIPYRYANVYQEDKFWPSSIATLREPYILRDYRGQTIVINPFQYNPVKKVLRIYTKITVKIKSEDNSQGVNEFHRNSSSEKIDSEFANIYKSHFQNFNSVQYVPVEEGRNMLIISDNRWLNELAPFVKWKSRKGINTKLVDVSTIGSSSASIKSYINNYFFQHGLNYVLLVGDIAQIPSMNSSQGISDPSYGYIYGNDSYAEIFVGRFSVESSADVKTQVDRSIQYEFNPDTINVPFNKGIVIGSNQGPGDDNEMDWEHAANMRADLMAYNFSTVTELYDDTHPTTTDLPGDPSTNDLRSAMINGSGVITYTGHGSYDSFSTTGFSSADLPTLFNNKRLPFIWSVACQNGDFASTSSPCFGESLLRSQSNGEPTGAVATFMSSINQSWSPPMDAQDEMIDILVNSYSNNIKRSFAGISVNGCFHMNDEYGNQGSEMTDTWIIFGDPSLEVRTAKPALMTVTHQPTIQVASSSLIVNCNVEGALVSLNLGNEIISTASVNSGIANLNFSALSSIDTIFITVTAYNMLPYTGYILITPANGPYVIFDSKHNTELNGNNNFVIDFGETIEVDVELANIGNADANWVNAVLSTTDPYVIILDSTSTWSNIPANSTSGNHSAFQYLVADSIPDQYEIVFMITLTDNSGNTWTTTFSEVVNAPDLKITEMLIDDSGTGNNNGLLEAGESAVLQFTCSNLGHCDVFNADVNLSTSSGFLNLGSNNLVLNSISKKSFKYASFNVSMLPGVAIGTPFDVALELKSGNYSDQKIYGESAGLIVEDFETGDFTKYNWARTANLPQQRWKINNVQPFEGLFSAMSGNISDGEATYLSISIDMPYYDTIGFWYKVSSELQWDFFRFKIDGGQVGEWSGTIPWTYAAFDIDPGIHTLVFSYDKNMVNSIGSDCAWIDNIRLPFGAVVTGIESNITDKSKLPYPNPSSDYININYNLASSSNVKIEIIDLKGSLIRSEILKNLNSGQQNYLLGVADLPSGIYLARVVSDKEIQSYRINVIH